MGQQYTRGSQVTFTVTTLNAFGHQITPDAQVSPVYTLYFNNPNSPIAIKTNVIMTPISSTFFYANVDTMLLSTGSYTATIAYIVDSITQTSTASFEVIDFDGATLLPIDPISKFRIRLKDNDIDPTRWVWSDQELSVYLQDALDDLNSAPARTNWFWFNVPLCFLQNIIRSAECLALEAQAIKLAHSPITYNDKGVSVNLQSQSGTYLSLANALRQKADEERLRIKRQFAYQMGFITMPSTPYMSNPPIRAFGRAWNL